MDNEFYKVDLHVHTPASKCYKGDKSEEGYWEILRSAVKNGVRVIAITDHNTIMGYEKLIELKNQTLNEYEVVKKYDIPEQQKLALEEKVNLLEQVYIILGVEITLNPGVHIIVLGDNDSQNDIKSLLDEVGYTIDNRGSDSDIEPNMDIKTFLGNSLLDGKIVIAPHVDSDKGIWSTLKGYYRASIFKSNVISAITCNNIKQLETIKELTRNDAEYKRNKPFVCINSSDAHIQSEIGDKYSYFKLTNFSFDDLKKAFDSPEDCISDTEKQDFFEYVKKCAEYNPTIYLNEINNLEASCYAILNNGYGCILLGINEKYQHSGINLTYNDTEKKLKDIINRIKIDNKSNNAKIKYEIEQLGSGKCVVVIIIESDGSRLWINDKDELYILNTKSGYKLATIREVAEIVRNRVITELQEFEERNDDAVRDAMTKIRHVLSPVSKYAIYDKINSQSIPISYYFNIKPVSPKSHKEDYDTKEFIYGQDKGNVFYSTPSSPRLEDTYLRYSCPIYQNNDNEYLKELIEIHSPQIVIDFGGGCHIIDSNEFSYFEALSPAVLLKPNDQFFEDEISLYNIIAWLKSDVFIWTCLQKNNDVNIYRPQILLNCFIPSINSFFTDTKIENKVKDILFLEHEFLRVVSPLMNLDDNESFEKIKQLCSEHNEKVNKKTAEIEILMNQVIDINEEQNEMIRNDLLNEKIYICNEGINEKKEIETACL
ncbi:MAG: PHP domain-containing protein [Oscillospiraceae bacterium]|nr:PHP domain-containing protein [Oscillospiraceae bacterium]